MCWSEGGKEGGGGDVVELRAEPVLPLSVSREGSQTRTPQQLVLNKHAEKVKKSLNGKHSVGVG